MGLKEVLFTDGNFDEKKAYIDAMATNDLLSVSKDIIKEIVDKCGSDGRLWINSKRRQGNNWNSLVEYVSCSYIVGIYVQDLDTDTTMNEYFTTFFAKGEYVSSNNRLNERVRYTEKQKGEVMRSILLECIYQQYNDDVQIGKLVEKLSHYSIINPVYNYFFKDYFRLSNLPFSYATSKPQYKTYCDGKKAVEEYIKEHAKELDGKGKEELQEIYKRVFKESFEKK